MNSVKSPTGPNGWPLIGNMLEARRDPLTFTLRLAREYGDVSRFHVGPYKGYLVNHPDGVRRVLQSNHRNYDKHNYDYEMLRPFLGEGLITSDGDHWMSERRLVQPAFHQEHLASVAEPMRASIRRLRDAWLPLAEQGKIIHVAQEMSRLALESVSRFMFGSDLGDMNQPVLEAFRVLNQEVARRFQALVPLPLWLPLPRNLAARRATKRLDRVLMGLMRRAEQEQSQSKLIEHLVQAHGQRGHEGSGQIRDEVVTLALAGHETTAALLSWTWYLLARHPEVERRLRLELKQVLAGREPKIAELEALGYTEQVLKEALRLYPPVWMISRRAKQADTIRGYRIPSDSVVALSPFAVHRDPELWQDPDRFDPQRFAPSQQEGRHAFAYFPFGGGPRLCIGADFAMMEAKLTLAVLLPHIRLKLVGDRRVRPEPLVTLRPQGGLPMRLEPVTA